MEVIPVDGGDVLALGVLGLVLAVFLGLVGSVALIDIRRELRRLRREVRTTTHAVRQAADADRHRHVMTDLSLGATQPPSEEHQ